MVSIYKGSRSDEWGTPRSLFDPLHAAYRFTVDLAATADNTLVPAFLANSLAETWPAKGCGFLNPPFSRAAEFFLKASHETLPMVGLYKSSNMETETWQDWILPHADWICILRKRTEYVRPGTTGHGVPFGSALIGFRCAPLAILDELGTVIVLRRRKVRA